MQNPTEGLYEGVPKVMGLVFCSEPGLTGFAFVSSGGAHTLSGNQVFEALRCAATRMSESLAARHLCSSRTAKLRRRAGFIEMRPALQPVPLVVPSIASTGIRIHQASATPALCYDELPY